MRSCKGILVVCCLVLCGAPIAAQSSPDECYHRAAAAYRAADWHAATAALSEFVGRCPEDPRSVGARFYLGEAHVQANQLAQGRASYRAFIDQLDGQPHDDEATARFRIGEASFLLKDNALAEAELSGFCDRYPDHTLVKYALPCLAELALGRGDFETALRTADRQLGSNCDRPHEAHLIVARSYYAMQEFEAARDACARIERDAEAGFDTTAKALLICAQSYAQQRNWDLAVRAFHRLANHRPALGLDADIEADVEAEAEATPDSGGYRAEALLGSAECYECMGERALASQSYASLLIEFPRSEVSQTATQRLVELVGNAKS